MRLAQARSRYLVQLAADGRSPHTIAQAERHLRQLERWLRATRRSDGLARIDHEDLAVFLAAEQTTHRADGTPKKPTSLNRLRSTLRTFFGYAHAVGYLASDPARRVRLARCAPPPPRGLSEAEGARLRKALATAKGEAAVRDRMLVDLLLGSGLRISEALALRAEDLDLRARTLHVARGKGQQPREVVLGRGLATRLRRYLRSRGGGPLWTAAGNPTLGRRQAHARITHWMAKAGLPPGLGPHSLRHSFATRLYGLTGDLRLVQHALGHRSLGSTVVYARVESRAWKRAVEALETASRS